MLKIVADSLVDEVQKIWSYSTGDITFNLCYSSYCSTAAVINLSAHNIRECRVVHVWFLAGVCTVRRLLESVYRQLLLEVVNCHNIFFFVLKCRILLMFDLIDWDCVGVGRMMTE